MTPRIIRNALAAGAVVTAMLAAPPESQAIFHWLRNAFSPRTTAVPVVAASPCVSCAPQVVQYVPQTSYRTQIVNVPVTTYRPVTVCGQCGPTTTYRPVVTYRPTTRLVPYTTYRPVVVAAPSVALRPVATTTLYAPTTRLYAPAVAAPACAGAPARAAVPSATPGYAAPSYRSSPSPSYATPSYPSPSTPGPTYSTPSPAPSSSQETPRPSLRPQTPQAPQQQTYEGSGNRGGTQSMRPIPDKNTNEAPAARPKASGKNTGTSGGPYFAPPASRTTMQPNRWAWNYTPVRWAARSVSHTQATAPKRLPATNGHRPAPTRPPLDDGGWVPVRPEGARSSK